jgi:hypothetical protein
VSELATEHGFSRVWHELSCVQVVAMPSRFDVDNDKLASLRAATVEIDPFELCRTDAAMGRASFA